MNETDGVVVLGEEGVLCKVGVHFFHQGVLLEEELVADDGGGEGDVELSASEVASECVEGGAGAGVPGFEDALGVQAGGYFHLFDIGFNHFFHGHGLFPVYMYSPLRLLHGTHL